MAWDVIPEMSEPSISREASTSTPNQSANEYPMKELAQRMRLPSVKASFDLVKALVAMPSDGKIVEKMTNLRVIIFPSIFVLGIWATLYEILGKKLAPNVITSFHRDTGRTMVQVGRHNFKLEDKYAFEFYFWLLSSIGWGEIKKFEFDANKVEGVMQFEYKGPLPGNATKEIPFHNHYRGEIIAAGEEALHMSLDVRETKCMAMGDPYCEFTWKKAEKQDSELNSISKGILEDEPKLAPAAPAETVTLKNDFKEMIKHLHMPDEGRVLSDSLQVATKDTHAIVGLTYKASEFLGEGTVRAVLVRTGNMFAKDDAKRFNTNGKQLVEDYLKFMSVAGWGKFQVLNLDEKGGEVVCENSAFAEEYPRGKRTVCYFVVGILSSLMERAFDHKYIVKEKDCIAKCDLKCRFEIKLVPK
jgi:predicted hydrocarbon binding protein